MLLAAWSFIKFFVGVHLSKYYQRLPCATWNTCTCLVAKVESISKEMVTLILFSICTVWTLVNKNLLQGHHIVNINPGYKIKSAPIHSFSNFTYIICIYIMSLSKQSVLFLTCHMFDLEHGTQVTINLQVISQNLIAI